MRWITWFRLGYRRVISLISIIKWNLAFLLGRTFLLSFQSTSVAICANIPALTWTFATSCFQKEKNTNAWQMPTGVGGGGGLVIEIAISKRIVGSQNEIGVFFFPTQYHSSSGDGWSSRHVVYCKILTNGWFFYLVLLTQPSKPYENQIPRRR